MNTENAFEYLSGKKKFDFSSAAALARKSAEEGIVLLENKGRVLPLPKDETIAFFGRMQKHYLMLGTGSGGRVNPPYTTNIYDSLSELGYRFDEEVSAFYEGFVLSHPYDCGNGWSHPHSQQEPEPDGRLVASAAKRAQTALFVITRIAGEDRDCIAEKGSYYLTDTERMTLDMLRAGFKKLVILLNIGNVMDLSWVESVAPDGLLLLWQGGMEGGRAAANIISGAACPSGRLPDSFLRSRSDYPAFGNTGEAGRNYYKEDIYVGYRRFSPSDERIIYPFGYGLSYSEFAVCLLNASREDDGCRITVSVCNLGICAGKTSVLCRLRQPQGKLGKPERVLCAFAKTKTLAKGESCVLTMYVSDEDIASYDDSGVTGNRYCFVLEKGEYVVSIGGNEDAAADSWSFVLNEDKLVKRCESALSPVLPFERLAKRDNEFVFEPAPLRVPSDETIPDTLPMTGDVGIKLSDVAEGKIDMRDFIAQLDKNDLVCIVRGEGMSSPKVTPGTAAAFGGVTERLKAFGIPAMCCTDGPSGVRMVSDAQCAAYPSAVCIASGFDEALAEEMYEQCGHELAVFCVDMLLGPGMNIHRDPLCGRNFEYFSEDPLLTGKTAAAICRGLSKAGVSGVIKHFLANNQETDRHGADSVISERAVREIYARPFGIAVRESDVCSVMTSYNPVNGRYAASNYDLTVRLLRRGLGFDGFVMTDWWAKVNDKDGSPCVTGLAGMVHARNDVYMVTPDAESRSDDLVSALENGGLTLGELQQCAADICGYAVKSLSFRAAKEGYGKVDLRETVKGKKPFSSGTIIENKVSFESGRAKKAVLRVCFVSETPELTQTNIRLNVNTKKAACFIIGGTGGKQTESLCEVSLVSGANEFVFTSESPSAYAVSAELFDIGTENN